MRSLIDFDEIAYEPNAEALNDLAAQVVAHLRSYFSNPDVKKVLKFHERQIAEFVRAQMAAHYFEDSDDGYDVTVSRGFESLKSSAYSVYTTESIRDFRIEPSDKSNMARYIPAREGPVQDRIPATPYQPDFAAEYGDVNWLIEVKAKNEMASPDVLAKKTAGELWCARASEHAIKDGGKSWRYALIAHDVIAENMMIEGLA